jgi:sugar lactone lactonase YvrE
LAAKEEPACQSPPLGSRTPQARFLRHHFREEDGIAFDDDGKLYVADRSNKRIQIFTPDGEYLGQCTGMAHGRAGPGRA